jgi:hypothetical protein
MHTVSATELDQQIADDFSWAQTAAEVQQNPEHFGKLVAVYQRRVLAVGRDRQLLAEQAARAAPVPGDQVVIVLVARPGLWEIPH